MTFHSYAFSCNTSSLAFEVVSDISHSPEEEGLPNSDIQIIVPGISEKGILNAPNKMFDIQLNSPSGATLDFSQHFEIRLFTSENGTNLIPFFNYNQEENKLSLKHNQTANFFKLIKESKEHSEIILSGFDSNNLGVSKLIAFYFGCKKHKRLAK